MTTVASRVVRSSPYRDVTVTWAIIVELLTQGVDSPARQELLSVNGIASAVLAEQAPKDAPIVVTCDGPRTRIYCLYDDDAIDGSDAKEDVLGYNPLKGQWAISLPCPEVDLDWMQRALQAKSTRITVRDLASKLLSEPESAASKVEEFVLDVNAFLKS